MLSKAIWVSFAVVMLFGIMIFGFVGVSITPALVEKEIPVNNNG